MSFNNKLELMMKIYNVTSRKLANAVHVDPSAISRWINGKRVPAMDSEIVDKIVSYFFHINAFDFQKKEFYKAVNISEDVTDSNNQDLKQKVKEWLFCPDNIYKPMLQEHRSSEVKTSREQINNLISKIGNSQNVISSKINPEDFKFYKGKEGSMEIFFGKNGVRNALLNVAYELLEQKIPGEFVLAGANNFYLNDESGFVELWINVLKLLLDNGHQVKVLYNLNKGLPEIIQLLSALLPLITTGRFEAYSNSEQAQKLSGVTIAVVPGKCAVLSMLSEDEVLSGHTYVFRDNSSVSYYNFKANRMFLDAQRLFTIYTATNMLSLLQDIYIIEESSDSRFVCRNGLTSLTIPMNLYKKLMYKSTLSKSQIQKRYELHRKRLETLKSRTNTHFMDICFIDALDKMIEKQGFMYALVDVFASGVVFAQPEDVLEHLKNTVKMLKDMDNFEIALVNKHDFFGGNSMYWAVMEDKAAIFSTWDPKGNPTCVMIKEHLVVNDCENYFREKWNDIPNENKSKSWVIKQISERIDKLELLINELSN